MTEPTIDLAVFRELQETAGAEFVAELVATFAEEAPQMLAELRAALNDGSAERFRRAAHSLKSNGLTFGALGLAAMARELELAGPDAPADDAAVAALAQAYARAAAALKALRHG